MLLDPSGGNGAEAADAAVVLLLKVVAALEEDAKVLATALELAVLVLKATEGGSQTVNVDGLAVVGYFGIAVELIAVFVTVVLVAVAIVIDGEVAVAGQIRDGSQVYRRRRDSVEIELGGSRGRSDAVGKHQGREAGAEGTQRHDAGTQNAAQRNEENTRLIDWMKEDDGGMS